MSSTATTRMRADDLDPDLRRPYRMMPPVAVQRAWQRRLANRAMRLAPAPRLSDGTTFEVVDFDVPGTGVRVFTPAGGSGGALLWIHGGGYVIGAAQMDDRACAGLAARLGITVVSVQYRLAPEHPFPAPLDDCLAAWEWLQAEASVRGIDPERVAVGGQSAGGGLAAALVQRLHDRGGVRPVAQLLYCPMLDDRTAATRAHDPRRHFAWTNRDNLLGWRSYLGAAPGGADVPAYAVPGRRADLAGLPPAWIGVGDIDLFHDEDVAYAEALRAAGVEVTTDIVPGAPHGFETIAWSSELAKAFRGRAEVWLGDRLVRA
ncbi:alpha/beta hydrolase [Agromyces mangrovi Wang et al. 2018]|uniref:alpha/beta hydrolase n=1 Tax=Agromyces mangrovi TaxID=1858653 RepID=UPI00257388FC|nr:alpha/beta hydrolase [Agromyces mangrovi]BDZ65395.1 esterase [Agromyces mangrovi]